MKTSYIVTRFMRDIEVQTVCLMQKRTLCFSFRMDSFFLAEMFKYLFLLFAESEDLPFDVEDYVFTTEAHLLPLSLSASSYSSFVPSNRTVGQVTQVHADNGTIKEDVLCIYNKINLTLQSEEELDDSNFDWTCPDTRLLFPDPSYPRNLREPIRSAVDKSCPRPSPNRYTKDYSHSFISARLLKEIHSSFVFCSVHFSQGAWHWSSSSEGSRLHGKQPGTSGAAQEDGSQSHPPERWQGAAGATCHSGTNKEEAEKPKKN